MTAVASFTRLIFLFLAGLVSAPDISFSAEPSNSINRLELGRRIYREGIRPSGETINAVIQGDIEITGEQVICGNCHRRSGMGSSEGREVIPGVTGDLLYNPLRLPTRRPPLPPELRPAYTTESLKAAIRDGINAAGKPMSPLMPRFDLDEEELGILIDYLNTLSTGIAPGVSDEEIHFATIVTDSLEPARRKALIDVLEVYFDQKNRETRYEDKRASNAPWHKEWQYSSYRKWVLHVWELKGPPESWQDQLEELFRQQPVFAVLSGVVPGSWRPVHDFCERSRLPCLFPTTVLPKLDDGGFYSLYFSKGMALEGRTIVSHIFDDDLLRKSVVQVFRDTDPVGETAAAAVRDALKERGGQSKDFHLKAGVKADGAFWQPVLEAAKKSVIVLWLGESDLETFWQQPAVIARGPERIYLSTTLVGTKPSGVSETAKEFVYFVHPYELPGKLNRLLARSTGWLRVKRIYSASEKQIQANAYFALKMAGEGLVHVRGYFNGDFFLERIEHMVDKATYTSVYPRISLAPNQRFVSKGCYIAKLQKEGNGGLVAITDWLTPGLK